ncbi:hypothetical protein PHJA_001843400 [Phtheirospermum japonicum]|uniref:Uncharacterized protein n=1 Tax=Phtheirospermum japonicum TaxID=374723 RepID=A0A830CMD9_9LAMI|nr:hypothetical protein PHJA_001843400 [Phtheirospermum japonicum]
MSTVFQVQGKQSLPVSHAQERGGGGGPGIRRRLSSISLNLKIQPPSTSAWTFQRPKSIAFASSSIRKWWGWGWGWGWVRILSRKPTFVTDLEMNGDEIGSHNKGSWRHVFYKVTSQLRRQLLGSDNVGLPQTFRYNSFNDGRPASLIH